MSSPHFFDEKTVTFAIGGTPPWPTSPDFNWGFRATGMIVAVDTANFVEYSFDGCNRHGKVFKKDQFIALDMVDADKIYFRAESATDVRVWAWEKQR